MLGWNVFLQWTGFFTGAVRFVRTRKVSFDSVMKNPTRFCGSCRWDSLFKDGARTIGF